MSYVPEKGLLPEIGVTTQKRKSYYTHWEELLPWQSFYTGRKDELLSWESYCSERGVNTLRKELLPWVTTSRGVTTLAEKESLEERISYFPEKELLLWERSYYPEGVTLRGRRSFGVTTLIERKSYCPETGVTTLKDKELLFREGGWVTNLGQKFLLWDRSYCPDTRVTIMTKRSYWP